MKTSKLTAIPALLLTAALLLSGCAGESATTTAGTTSSAPASTSAPASGDSTTPGGTIADPGTTADPGTDPTTPAPPADVNLEALIDEIYGSISGIEFPTLINGAVDLSDQSRFRYVYGIDVPASAVSAVASEPLIGSIPYTMALLKLDDTTDIASIASSIEKGVNPAKWVCVVASTVKTAYKGNVILLIMDKDASRADAVIDAFLKAMD